MIGASTPKSLKAILDCTLRTLSQPPFTGNTLQTEGEDKSISSKDIPISLRKFYLSSSTVYQKNEFSFLFLKQVCLRASGGRIFL